MIRTRKIALALALSLVAVTSIAAEPAKKDTTTSQSTLLEKIKALTCTAKCKW